MPEKLQPISIIQFESSYLAHPAYFEEEAKKFQKELEVLGITIINPFVEERKEFGADHRPMEWWQSPHSPQEAEHIIERDLKWIREVDSLVSFVPEPRGFGTMMEIFYAAKLLGKPVFIYTSKKFRFHPWLMYFGQVFTDRQFMLNVLKRREEWKDIGFRFAIGGKMGTGKSSLADFLMKCFQFKKYSFAAKLKELAADLFDMEVKDRQLLQVLGTKVREVEKDAWCGYVLKQIRADKSRRVVIDDMRYLNEAELLQKNDFTLIKLYTPDSFISKRNVAGYTPEMRQHPSEIEIDAIDPHYTIDTSGSLEQAYDAIMGIMEREVDFP